MSNYITAGSSAILLLLCTLFYSPLNAQDAYWQQHVDTRINVQLDDTKHFLNAEIFMNYVNNSPDTLNYIYLHLYPNAYKNDRTEFTRQTVEDKDLDFYFSKEEDKGYIDSLNFTVNGKTAKLVLEKDIDIAKLFLPQPLLPGDSVKLHSPFRVKIPKTFSRLGHSGQSYQISQWFPKPAVYDKNGWHPFPYLNQGEFYSEFGSYDVSVTLPEDYILMATGNLIDGEKEEKWLDEVSKQNEQIAEPARVTEKPVKMKTLRFVEHNIHDFAWFADKRWLVKKDTVSIPGKTESVIVYRCYFPQHQKAWKRSDNAVSAALQGYSRDMGIYPFKTVKVVEGALTSSAGGMEYPTITVIASSSSSESIETAIIHEVGHNWFYGILGSNERRYPWMDEGINSFYEKKFSISRSMNLKGRSIMYWAYALLSGEHDLLAADKEADFYPDINYGIDIYEKAPRYLTWLELYMGADSFSNAMQDYYQSYKFKHPQPEDFERIFKKHTSKDVSWFFEALSSDKSVDFSIVSMKQRRDSVYLKLKNKTGLKGPVLLHFRESKNTVDSGSQDQWTTSAYLTSPFENNSYLVVDNPFPGKKLRYSYIDSRIPDFNPSNNASSKPFSVRSFWGLNDAPGYKMWMLPTLGYNYYDGFMLGLGFHNLTIPTNKFQYALSPMFGFKSHKFVGTGFLSYTWFFSSGMFKDLVFKLEGKTFDYKKSSLNIDRNLAAGYTKISPELLFNFRKPFPRSTVERSLLLKGYQINEQDLSFRQLETDSLYRPEVTAAQQSWYARIRYDYANKRTFNPYAYAAEAQLGKVFVKLSLEGNIRMDYFMKNKAFYARAYVGKLIGLSGNAYDWQRYSLSSVYNGMNDYLYDYTFVDRGRGKTFVANQMTMREGGFKMNTLQYLNTIGTSDNWLASLNLESDIPLKGIPVRLFGDFAFLPASNTSGFYTMFEAGLSLHLSNVATIYVPLVLSKDLNSYSKYILGKNRFLKSIAFEINLERIPWTNMGKMLTRLR